jgi:arylsulfatase A-like enzyme
MRTWLPILLLACGSADSDPENSSPQTEPGSFASSLVITSLFQEKLPQTASPPLRQRGRTVIRLLELLSTSTLELPSDNMSGEWQTRRLLDGPWIPSKSPGGWKTRLPIQYKDDIASGQPRNINMLRNGSPLLYRSQASRIESGEASWFVQDGWVYLHRVEDPRKWAQPPELERISQARAAERLNLQSSGLSAAEFSTVSITLAETTREALLLPAPGRLTTQLRLPEGAILRMGVGIAEVPGLDTEARARIDLRIDGERAWSREVEEGEGWQDVEIPLSPWSGEEVELELHSQMLGDRAGDWVVLAEPEILGAPTQEGPRRIVVLGLDTLRPDHIGAHGYARDTTPFLDSLATRSLIFESAWAPAPRTRPSFRTVNTGRWPLAARSAPTLGEMLSRDGFSTAGIVANVHLSPEMGFSDGYGRWRYAHSGDATDQIDHALEWLGTHSEEDSFLFLHFMDPHIFYLAPAPWTDHFTTLPRPEHLSDRFNRRVVESLQKQGKLDPETQAFIQARYDGEIAYLDSQLQRLVDALDQLPGETWVVLLSDHGEEFWDHGGFEHNHSLYQELTRALLWIRPPVGTLEEGPYRSLSDVSLADLAPTLLDLVGIETKKHPPLDGVSLLPFLDGESSAARSRLQTTLASRVLPMGHLMYGKERWGVISERHKYILHRWSGVQELYDLSVDPSEQSDLTTTSEDLSQWWSALEEATGYPTGRGWRVELKNLDQEFSLRTDEPMRGAEITDPESSRERRANQEWGISPPVRAADVAQLEQSSDGRVLRLSPGGHTQGQLAILGELKQVEVLNREGVVIGTLRSGQTLTLPGVGQLSAAESVLILAGESEDPRLEVRMDAELQQSLESLGYLE